MFELASKTTDENVGVFLVQEAHARVKDEKPLDKVVAQCPACKSYSDFQLVTVRQSSYFGLAALTASYVIAAEVSEKLKRQDADMRRAKAGRLMKYLNEIAQEESKRTRNRMLDVYYQSVDYERQIFESCYRAVP